MTNEIASEYCGDNVTFTFETNEKATEKQINFIKLICETIGNYSINIDTCSKIEASQFISKHIKEFKLYNELQDTWGLEHGYI